MKRGKKNLQKMGQLQLSFGMIFSIVLIIIFIAFAFYTITKFLELQDSMKIGQFGSNLQTDIDKVWKSSQASQNREYSLPPKISSVCFKDDEYENLVFNSDQIIPGKKIEHIDTEKTIGTKDSFCINNIDGKVKMIIKKEYGDALVTITSNEAK